jgi:starvation-inducible DNA-binding protein
MTNRPRQILTDVARDATVPALQSVLYDLVELALQGKQAHWNLVGRHFRSVHLQLDEIVAAVRDGSDEVAERIATLGVSPDGQALGVADRSRLGSFPGGLLSVEETVTSYSDRLAEAIDGLRDSIAVVGEHDPISEDILIGISAGLEKQLWMLQSQED